MRYFYLIGLFFFLFVIPYANADTSSLEKECMEEINAIRKKQGLKPLKSWPQLAVCARAHSQNMASNKVAFGHKGFEQRAAKMQKQKQLKSFAENVAYCLNYDNPVKVVAKEWMNSPSHRKNILDDFDETGLGVAISKEGKVYFTQLFAKRNLN